MSEQSTFISRIGGWFRKSNRIENHNGGQDSDDLALNGDPSSQSQIIEARSSFLRPWAKRDAAITHLQEGFTTLTDLMTSIKDNLERQNQRQSELNQYLS